MATRTRQNYITSYTIPAVSECNEFLQEAETGRHNKVLVHCNAGVSRSLIVPYYTVLYCTVLYCTVLYYAGPPRW